MLLTVVLMVELTSRVARADAVAVVVPTDGLHLRAGPSIEQRMLDLIPGGTRIAITGPAADGWYPAVYRGQRGWVLGTFVTFDELTAAAARRAIVTPPDGLNLRTAPYEGAGIITVLAGGTAVTATGQATTDGWALVQVAEQSGWVNASYLAFEPAASASPTATPAPAALISLPSAPPPVSAVGTPAMGAPMPSTGARVIVHYYDPVFEGSRMYCGGVYHADDLTIAATNNWPCGTVLRVCHGAACVVATVRDKGSMGQDELDLSASAFTKLAPLGAGEITATVEVVTQ